MTLTGSLPDGEVAPIKAALTQAHAQAVPAGPVLIDQVAIFKQESRTSRFVLLDSIPLG